MSSPIRAAVIGVGALGREHARIYAQLAAAGSVTLAGVFDTSPEAAKKVAAKCQTRAFDSLEEAAAHADAFSVVTPTSTHHAIALPLLRRGRHVLVEKPMAPNAREASELVEAATASRAVLQVGHVERFNPVFTYLQSAAAEPRFVEVHRLSPYPARSTDIGVVLDLMIHDLDIVQAIVRSAVVDIGAVGLAVLSTTEDIANARIKFANGCVANLTVSRISPERLRKIRVFSAGPSPSYISLDYRAQEGFIYRVAREDESSSSLITKLLRGRDAAIVSEFGGKRIVREPVPLIKDEPLRLELEHFIASVKARSSPLVSGESAREALDLAFEITRQIREASP